MPTLSEETLAKRRDDILDSALRCFAKKGYRATSMRDLCQEATCSLGGIYVHFKSKDDILEGLAGRFSARRQQLISDLTHKGNLTTVQALGAMLMPLETEEGQQENYADISLMGEAAHTDVLKKAMVETDKEYFALFAALSNSQRASTDAVITTALLYGLLVLSAFHPDVDRKAAIARFGEFLSK